MEPPGWENMPESSTYWVSTGRGTLREDAAPLEPSNYNLYVNLLIEGQQLEPLRSRCPSLHMDICRLRRQRPFVRTLLNLAALQGVTILDILLRPKEAAAKPLFDRLSDFDGVPFPPVVIAEASIKVERVVTALLSQAGLALPPLDLLCRHEQVRATCYSRFHETSSARYREAFRRQQGYKRIGGLGFYRAFCNAIHIARECPDISRAELAQRVGDLSKLRADKLDGVAATAIELLRLRGD